ncbi:M48 family metallopeptidase [Streptomyces sp. APSN-46.1]|uniref:M48 family metallopeptidase n=1 Tax=Streptomyces sp. APSN-46.1 TaxID=2929049 RepID=UPI001FB52E31|nr:M48 family metallopeptidase [Streptomyces sp. APSN-46.1]MCJ1677794.1 M48 family metallopeptidase [Streptomyces sp. APSN-46.1]
MAASLRALRALVLLAGFYLLGIALLAVLAAADWAAATWLHPAVAGKILIVTVVLAIPIVRGMFMLRTPKGEPLPGIPVTEGQEPALWQAVREVAEQVGTRAPDEIVLIDEVNAAVGEDARLLGLLPGTRRLYLGLPLMTGLDEMQLRAVLAHEMGHYANLDTRLTPLIARGRAQLIRTVAHFHERADKKIAKERAKQEKKAEKRLAQGKKAKEIDTDGEGAMYRAMAAVYTAYGKFYLRASLSGARRQELAADLAAVRIAGRDATASALRELNALDWAHDFYLRCYASIGLGSGLMPPEGQFFGGFRTMLAARSADLDELRTELSTEPASPYDSHPALAERVARIEALPDDGRAAQAARPSLDLLADADASVAALEPAVLSPQVLALPRVSWEELVHATMLRYSGQRTAAVHEAVTAEGVTGGGVTSGGIAAEGLTGDGITGDGVTAEAGTAEAGTGDRAEAGAPDLAALLDAIDADPALRWRLADRFPKSEEAAAATGRVAREFARPVVRRALKQLADVELTARGLARWQLSWSESATLGYRSDIYDRLDEALDAAVADQSDTEPLRKLVLAP